jgi:hypothetical protein
MDKKEILERIADIKAEVEKDQFNIIREKILERRFHLHKSHRNFLTRGLIQKIRKRLILEISLILEPILDKQKEINLRFLDEIKRLREACSLQEQNQQKEENETKNSRPLKKDQE